MRELVEVLAAVAAGLPQQQYGFYRLEPFLFYTLFPTFIKVDIVV